MLKFNKKEKALLSLLAVGLMMMVPLAFMMPVHAQTAPSGTFIWGTPVSTPVTTLNPLTATNLAGEATGIMYPSLLYSLSDGSLVPYLAENYTVNSNGTVYTFYLNPNAEWFNGTTEVGPITANDVVFTFKVITTNTTLDAYGVHTFLKSVVALNNETVQFTLTSPTVMALTYLSTQHIIPAVWGTYVQNISQIGSYTNLDIGHEIQAGPFLLQSVTETALTFTANTHFWLGSPHVATFIIEPFKSTSSMTLSFENGQIDAEYPAISDYYALKSMPNVVNVIYKMPWGYFLWDNTQQAPFNNTDFRIGLAYAINKTEIMQKAEDGIGGAPSFGGEPWTNYSWWAPNLPYYHYNTTQAINYFKMAGLVQKGGFWYYPNGTMVKLNIIEPDISDWMTAASLITNDLSSIGFSVTYSVIPIGTWATDIFATKNWTELSYFGATPSFSNPWYVIWDLYDYQSFWDKHITHWSNATVNQLLNESFTMASNYTGMLNLLFKAQYIIANQVPMVPIGDIGNYYAYNSHKITGFKTIDTPTGIINLLSISVPSTTSTTTTTTSSSHNNTTSSTIPAYVYGIVAVVVIIIIAVPVAYVVSKRGKSKKEEEEKEEEKKQ
ncbi:MAG: ABC transporter substrate-binding protein [Thermoplasmatales archaeon]